MLTRLKSMIKGRLLHRPDQKISYEYLGSIYGGWPVVPGYISSGSTVLSFGLGTDISFDLELIKRFGCTVIGFDPTPRSIDWLKTQTLPRGFSYHEIGIAAEDSEKKFYPPDNPEHASFSVQSTSHKEPIIAPVKRLTTILDEMKLPVPDVLKMDIEGFEYSVMDDILQTTVRPKQLLVEFHHTMYGIPNSRTIATVDKIKDAGYRLFYVSDAGLEYGFFKAREN